MIRVVIDPGVFVSALIGQRGGAPDLVLRAFADDRIEVVASPLLLAELEDVLRRPKFAHFVDARGVSEYVERVRRHATVVDDPPDRPTVTRDPKDDYLVALARQQRAEAIVSGDRDLGSARRRYGLPAKWSTVWLEADAHRFSRRSGRAELQGQRAGETASLPPRLRPPARRRRAAGMEAGGEAHRSFAPPRP